MKNKSHLKLNKKVLIISSWAPPKIGGAQNLYNVFSNIDPAGYSILTSIKNTEGKNNAFGSQLECSYFFYDENARETATGNPVPRNKYFYVIKKFPFIFTTVRNIISTIKFFTFKIRLLNALYAKAKKIIVHEKIDLLIGLSDTETNLVSTFLLSKITGKPFVLYLFDLYYGNLLNFPYNIIARIFEPIIFRNAKHIIVTNDATKEYYVQKYGDAEKYSIIYNCVSPDEYLVHTPAISINVEDKVNIVFTGSIYWAQESSLDNLLNLVNMNPVLNVGVTIYCPAPPKNLVNKFNDNRNIKFTSAPQSEMSKIQNNADILFLPLSWNTEAPDIIRTASPGKLADYLIATRPILVHAPSYSFIAHYARENEFAEVVSTESQGDLILGIRKLIEDKRYADTLVSSAKKTFYRNHDAYTNAEKITNIINNSL